MIGCFSKRPTLGAYGPKLRIWAAQEAEVISGGGEQGVTASQAQLPVDYAPFYDLI
jgi:hypothetical protein